MLEAASNIGVECSDVNVQLKKTAFLISLASAGRISEITALQRGDDSIQYLASGDVRLTPDELFMAKNESSDDRWEPWSIPPLPEYPPLCPVTALRRYLELTKDITTGQLFRCPDSGKDLTKKQLAQKIVYFIDKADPNTQASVHQIRKLGSSLNFFQYLDFEELVKYTHWKSVRVFHKHYMKRIPKLSVPVIAVGKVVRPR